MADPWPATLPLPMLPIRWQSGQGALHTQTDIGPGKSRRITTAVAEAFSFRVVLRSTSELDIFETFWKTTLAFGSLPFDLAEYPGSGTSTIKLLGYSITDLGGGRFEVMGDAQRIGQT